MGIRIATGRSRKSGCAPLFNKGETMELKKKVEVATTSPKRFVEAIIELAKLGAEIPANAPVYKGIVMRTVLEIDEAVLIPNNPIMRVIPVEGKKREKLAQEKASQPVAKKTAKKASKKPAKKAEEKPTKGEDSAAEGKQEENK